jgi:hypothetical protein
MKLLIFLTLALGFLGCKQADKKTEALAPANAGMASLPVDSSQFTTIQWIEQTRDFGKITEGQKLEISFKFKNTGDKPLIIESARASCGCTVAEPPKEPIAPGGEGEIRGSFDSNGKNGTQHKSIYVMANTKVTQSHELNFTVEVEKKQ